MKRFVYAIALAVMVCIVSGTPVQAATTTSKLAPCVTKTHKQVKNTYKTETISHTTTQQTDATLPKGQTKTLQAGADGKRLITYTTTYKKGKLSGCKHTGTKVTLQPQSTIIATGTYVAPAPAPKSVVAPTPAPITPTPAPSSCTNGSYVNSAGNTVCSPETNTGGGAPAGATAQCIDGSYSFSQSHSGTCSHHGGVATWL